MLDGLNSTSFETLFLISACIVYCQFLLFDFCLVRCFYSIQCFLWCSAFVWFNSFVQCSNYSVYVLSWSWKCIPGNSIPLNINHQAQAVSKHQTADSAIFCLSIGARGLLRSWYPEPISPYRLSRRRDKTLVCLVGMLTHSWSVLVECWLVCSGALLTLVCFSVILTVPSLVWCNVWLWSALVWWHLV